MLSTMFTNDVRQTLDQFRRSVDQVFENFYSYPNQAAESSATAERGWTFSPVVESAWNESHLTLRAVLPGVAQNDLRVTVQNNQLVLDGERKRPEGFEKNAYTQLAYGKFYVAWNLPTGLDMEHVNCRLQDGILEIQIPIQEASKPKQIQVNVGTGQKSISA